MNRRSRASCRWYPTLPSRVVLPDGADTATESGTIVRRGVRVRANDPIQVVGVSTVPFTSEAFLALPVAALGRDYLVQAFRNNLTGFPELNGSQFAVVGTAPNTDVEITLPVAAGGHPAGVPFLVRLGAGDDHPIRSIDDAPADLTGARIHASQPVAVLAGHMCANLDAANAGYCNHLVEQLLPVTAWRRDFVLVPFAERAGGDRLAVLARENGTKVRIGGSMEGTASGGRIVVEEFLRSSCALGLEACARDAIRPQRDFNNGPASPALVGDPAMVLVPPTNYYAREFRLPRAVEFTGHRFINVVAPADRTHDLRLNGDEIWSLFAPIPGTAYATAQVPLFTVAGDYLLTSPVPVGVTAYAWSEADGYAFPHCCFWGPGAACDPVRVGRVHNGRRRILPARIAQSARSTRRHRQLRHAGADPPDAGSSRRHAARSRPPHRPHRRGGPLGEPRDMRAHGLDPRRQPAADRLSPALFPKCRNGQPIRVEYAPSAHTGCQGLDSGDL